MLELVSPHAIARGVLVLIRDESLAGRVLVWFAEAEPYLLPERVPVDGRGGAMPIERSNRRVSAARIASLARQLLDASSLCAIATIAPRDSAHVNTAYFAWSPTLEIVWLSEPRARHSRNLRTNSSAAVAVYDSTQTWGGPDRGIQLFGTAQEVDDSGRTRIEEIYAERFPDFRDADLGVYRFYVLSPRRLKLFDEPLLGAATFVTARIGRGGEPIWERTEIYRPTA